MLAVDPGARGTRWSLGVKDRLAHEGGCPRPAWRHDVVPRQWPDTPSVRTVARSHSRTREGRESASREEAAARGEARRRRRPSLPCTGPVWVQWTLDSHVRTSSGAPGKAWGPGPGPGSAERVRVRAPGGGGGSLPCAGGRRPRTPGAAGRFCPGARRASRPDRARTRRLRPGARPAHRAGA